ncbi:MAG: aminoglycoside N(3)-acetyltransferase [Myxococcota bacterium]
MTRSQGLEPPITAEALVRDLRALGVREGELLLVHTSLRSLSGARSMVIGGAVAVVDALLRTVGEAGTIAMPTFSSYLSEPSLWRRPAAPEEWWPAVRAHLPAWQRERTPAQGVGTVPEIFRTTPGVLRSDHPHASFAARGPDARSLLDPHPLEDALGEDSPLGRMAALGGRAVMLGSPWHSCTAFHLGELRMRPPPPVHRQGAPMLRNGERQWVEWTEREVTTDGFDRLGELFERCGAVTTGTVGRATARLFDIAAAGDFAAEHLPALRRR